MNKLLVKSDGLGLSEGKAAQSALKRSFTMPPFSVWNTRDGDWQTRKRRWLALGIQSEVGRDHLLLLRGGKGNSKDQAEDIGRRYGLSAKETAKVGKGAGRFTSATSIFDPVVCELVYNWFCPPGGQVVDPFAGGSVRGIVASVLGLRYWGCDLSAEQIAANRTQINPSTTGPHPPTWVQGDSTEKLSEAPRADALFSCPPFGDLEQYSNDPRDLSSRSYPEFLEGYRHIIRLACKRLRNDRFACFVVASFRDKKTGEIYDLPGDTIRAFADASLSWYNDIVLVNAIGTGAVRARVVFRKRKVVKLHQQVQVFVKGSPPDEW